MDGAAEINNYKAMEKKIKLIKHYLEAVNQSFILNPRDTSSFAASSELVLTRKGKLWGREKLILELRGYEGFYVIPEALSPVQQLNLAEMCLTEWIEPPNISNIPEQPSQYWQRYIMDTDVKEKREACAMKRRRTSSLDRLRWVTLGYHYDWEKRKYASQYNTFPPELSILCSDIAHACNGSYRLSSQAGIVNLYPRGAVMGGHQDDAEITLDHPVVSLSIGCACVFLVGGLSKEETPVPILLHSGDVVVLGGPSRLRYHGVGKVFNCERYGGIYSSIDCALTLLFVYNHKLAVVPDTTSANNALESEAPFSISKERAAHQLELIDFITSTRININVRQVYPCLNLLT